MKDKEGNDYGDSDSWDEHYFDVGGKEGEEWGNDEREEGGNNDDDEERKEEEEEGKGDGSRLSYHVYDQQDRGGSI